MRFRFLCRCLLLVAASASTASAASGDDEILGGADARIEKHRKGDVSLLVTGPDGTPAANVTIAIEQTRHAFLFGSNIFILGKCRKPEDNAAYEKHFDGLLNFATAPFYWWGYEAERGRPDYDKTDRIVAWCKAHGILVKGHPLMWNYVDPKWLPDDPAEVRRLQLERIDACVRRFAGKIDFWDVVNEVAEFERAEILKNAPKLTAAAKAVGTMEFVRQAFQTARRANPDAVLLINDYIVDHRYADNVIARLVDDHGRRLYDVIGIQCHQHGGAWTAKHAWEICERFARFGVPLHFTEATILSGEHGWDLTTTRPGYTWGSHSEGEARQAKEVVRFYTTLFSHPAVQAITWWDFSDQMAWQAAPAGLLRQDMTPKPAYEELHRLVKGKWWTKTATTTDARGEAAFRGFYGDYRATFTVGGRKYERTFPVRANADNRIVLRATKE